MAGAPGYSVQSGLGRALDPFEREPLLKLEACDLEDLKSCTELLSAHDHADIDLRNSLKQFRHLSDLPKQSPLHLVGLFAIIESLLTHKPDPKDPSDSLTRQVKTKFVLLNKRFKRKLDYGAHFGHATEEQVWKDLYALRSLAAHGAQLSYGRLKSADNALRFLRLAASAVLRHALDEPLLVKDLRQC